MSQKYPYVIAEINSGHGGSIEEALRAVEIAKSAGANAIKFQSWQPESLHSAEYLARNRILGKIYRKLAVSDEQLATIAQSCNEHSIDFSSTAYTVRELNYLVSLSPAFLKIASMDLVNEDLRTEAFRSEIPVVMSTGMCSFTEIDAAVAHHAREGTAPLTLLHCNAEYPTIAERAGIGGCKQLAERYPTVAIGYSDHTESEISGIIAASMGCTIIEKHFTLDKDQLGFDNAMALDGTQLKRFVENIRLASVMAGSYDFDCRPDRQQAETMRRSAHAARPIDSGEHLSSEDIVWLRPGNGIQMSSMARLVGAKVKVSLEKGTQISWEDILHG